MEWSDIRSLVERECSYPEEEIRKREEEVINVIITEFAPEIHHLKVPIPAACPGAI